MNIILISLDTLCASHVSCYGWPAPTTPQIDRWAEQAAVFTRCYASDVPTPPSYTSILSGRFGVHHGIFGFQDPATYRPGPPLLQEHLSQAGWETCALSNLFYVCPWLGGGWKTIMPPGLRFQGGRAPDVSDVAIRWLGANADRGNAFLFVHYWEPHCPYTRAPEDHRRLFPTADYEERAPSLKILQSNPIMARYYWQHQRAVPTGPPMSPAEAMARYDAQVHFGDEHVGRLLRYLDESGLADSTAVIITSDHGEAFGEYGTFDHHTCYEHIAHVPLIIRVPGAAARKIEGFVYGADLMPTILELAGIARPEGLDGRSLLPSIQAGQPTPHSFIVSDCNALVTQRLIVRDQWALAHTLFAGPLEHVKPIELFEVGGDPERDLAAAYPDVVSDLRTLLADWLTEKLGGEPDRLHRFGLEGGWTLRMGGFMQGVMEDLDYARRNKPLWETLCRMHGPFFRSLPALLEAGGWRCMSPSAGPLSTLHGREQGATR